MSESNRKLTSEELDSVAGGGIAFSEGVTKQDMLLFMLDKIWDYEYLGYPAALQKALEYNKQISNTLLTDQDIIDAAISMLGREALGM